MKSLLYKARELKKGYNLVVKPEKGGLRYTEFGRVWLPEIGDSACFESEGTECVLDILQGKCTVKLSRPGKPGPAFAGVGERPDPFSGPPTMVYIPSGWSYEIIAESPGVEIAAFRALAVEVGEPRVVGPNDVIAADRGSLNWKRRVYSGVVENVEAHRLLVGETFNAPGCWSSYPPHKHDELQGSEIPMEEVYFFKVQPKSGFGVQMVYTDPNSGGEQYDVAYRVEDGDTVILPRGYHPVVAAPGYEVAYFWALAGDIRKYGAWRDDPRHAWVNQ